MHVNGKISKEELELKERTEMNLLQQDGKFGKEQAAEYTRKALQKHHKAREDKELNGANKAVI